MIKMALCHLLAALLRIYIITACLLVIGPYLVLEKIAPNTAKIVDEAMDRHCENISGTIYTLEY